MASTDGRRGDYGLGYHYGDIPDGVVCGNLGQLKRGSDLTGACWYCVIGLAATGVWRSIGIVPLIVLNLIQHCDGVLLLWWKVA